MSTVSSLLSAVEKTQKTKAVTVAENFHAMALRLADLEHDEPGRKWGDAPAASPIDNLDPTLLAEVELVVIAANRTTGDLRAAVDKIRRRRRAAAEIATIEAQEDGETDREVNARLQAADQRRREALEECASIARESQLRAARRDSNQQKLHALRREILETAVDQQAVERFQTAVSALTRLREDLRQNKARLVAIDNGHCPFGESADAVKDRIAILEEQATQAEHELADAEAGALTVE